LLVYQVVAEGISLHQQHNISIDIDLAFALIFPDLDNLKRKYAIVVTWLS
jgi:hypothetical protein